MPKARKTRGRPKTISCPRCGKKFCSETNVLQHMNQPTSICYASSWIEEQSLYQLHQTAADEHFDSDFEGHDTPEAAHPSEPGPDYQPHFPSFPPPTPYNALDNPGIDPGDIQMDTEPFDGQAQAEGTFTETYPGCSTAYPGGSTFTQRFWQDKHAEERRENLYFPFASSDEWQFVSWCMRSGLSMAGIDSLLSLNVIKKISFSFRTAKDLRARVETLPAGPKWLCERLEPEYHTKKPVDLFYRSPLECLQALLSNPLLAPHISFIPRKIWSSSARICRIYEDWLSGDCAWEMQEKIPSDGTLLGVVLSSDKTNISVISGNRMAHPVIISLANIDPEIRSKTSLHTYLLLALLPIAKFTHKHTRTRSLFQDRLFHAALNRVLEPLKIAARVGYMMDDPVGNLRYCYTPIAAYIADTPEQCLAACVGPKASPLTTATSKQFGDPIRHDPRTGSHTLVAIRQASEKCSPKEHKAFLNHAKSLSLNGVVEPFWDDWPLCCPSRFLHVEPLHHFHRFAWDHDVKWCIEVVSAPEIDFRFSLLQTTIGYRAFDDGISKLKQVTGRDHRAVQRYLVGIIAGAVPLRFLTAVRALVDFRYLAQAPAFSDHSLKRLTDALQVFHDNKDSIVQAGGRKDSLGWEIPKLELLQSVVSNIQRSGPIMQWSADATEHAHVQEIKTPARMGNNQNYYNQIARHLDRSDKCFRFDLATCLETRNMKTVARESENADENVEDNADIDGDGDDDDDGDDSYLGQHLQPFRSTVDYFSVADSLVRGHIPDAPRPHRTFATSTTAFHVATKPSLRLTIDEAAARFRIPNLRQAIKDFLLQRIEDNAGHSTTGIGTQDCSLPFDRIQIWYKIRIQQVLYHGSGKVDAPQSVRALPPSSDHPHGLYDAVIASPGSDSDWPLHGIDGHNVAQLRLIFRPLNTDYFVAYIQRFNIVQRRDFSNGVHPGTGMHLLRRATKPDGTRIGTVIPVSQIRSPAHLIPHFGKEAHSRLTKESGYELSSEFWLNKFWSKEFYHALCPV